MRLYLGGGWGLTRGTCRAWFLHRDDFRGLVWRLAPRLNRLDRFYAITFDLLN